jgi:hypothetical protein
LELRSSNRSRSFASTKGRERPLDQKITQTPDLRVE